eukprot:scaffold5999_cov149-Amphora_coffeaeformis.AAC.9
MEDRTPGVAARAKEWTLSGLGQRNIADTPAVVKSKRGSIFRPPDPLHYFPPHSLQKKASKNIINSKSCVSLSLRLPLPHNSAIMTLKTIQKRSSEVALAAMT